MYSKKLINKASKYTGLMLTVDKKFFIKLLHKLVFAIALNG